MDQYMTRSRERNGFGDGPAVGLESGGRPVVQPLVDLRDVEVHYTVKGGLGREASQIKAADGVSLRIMPGATLGLVGGTGSGKSTVAQVIAGMVDATGGTLTVAGQVVDGLDKEKRRSLRRVVQMVPQDPFSSSNPRMRVRDIIAEPLTLGRPFLGNARRAGIDARVEELLQLVGSRRREPTPTRTSSAAVNASGSRWPGLWRPSPS